MDSRKTSYSSSSSSSSSSSIGPWEYEVFLSFYDEDAKHNFIDHLYAVLHRKRIRTFKIDDLRGEATRSFACYREVKVGSCNSLRQLRSFQLVFG